MKLFPEARSSLTTQNTILLALMIPIALVIFGHSIYQTMGPLGATDFHSYWYHGQFIWAGENPYQAFFEGSTLEYLSPPQPGLANTPANTLPLVLLLSLFSALPWQSAKLIWMIVNLALTFLIPILTIKLLPQSKEMSSFWKLVIYFLFILLQGTRIANWVGQTSLFIFACMLGAIVLMSRSKLLAGILLGLALSKYSLAISIVLFFLIKREFLILSIGMSVQLLGVSIASWLGNHSLLLTVEYYGRMVGHHSSLPGIHLASLFPIDSLFAPLLMVIGSVGLLLYLWRNHADHFPNSGLSFVYGDIQLLSILMLWSLLAVYHRAYDTLIVIVFIAMLVHRLCQTQCWHLSKRPRWLVAFGIIFMAVMIIPSSLMGFVLPANLMPAWYQFVSAATTVALMAAIGVSLWLYRSSGPLGETDPII